MEKSDSLIHDVDVELPAMLDEVAWLFNLRGNE